MSRHSTPRGRSQVTALVALWFVLVIVTVLWGVPHIERALTDQAESVLGDLPVDVRMSGRDLTLIALGPVDVAEAARQIVESISGIRRVSGLTVTASALDAVTVNPETQPRPVEPVLDDPSLIVRADRGTFTLSGSVARRRDRPGADIRGHRRLRRGPGDRRGSGQRRYTFSRMAR